MKAHSEDITPGSLVGGAGVGAGGEGVSFVETSQGPEALQILKELASCLEKQQKGRVRFRERKEPLRGIGDGKQDCGDKWQAEPHGAMRHPPGLASDWHPFKYRSFTQRLSSGWEGRTWALDVPIPSLSKTKAPWSTSSHLLQGSSGPIWQRQPAFHLCEFTCSVYLMKRNRA